MSETTTTAPATIDARDFRDVMGHYPTGVVFVSGMVDGDPVGMVVGTFSSVSLEPPLVSFMPMTTSGTYGRLRQAEHLCISVLAHDQMATVRTLAGRDPDKLSKVAWTPSAAGAPQLDGAVAHIHGRIDREIEAGDHYITLVAVDDLAVARPTTPLLFFQGGYGGFSTTGMSAHVDKDLISAVRLAEAARPQLDALAYRIGGSAAALVQVSAIDQTIGAASYGPSVQSEERLGVRIPLIPPLGEGAVAWSDEQIEQWVSRIWPVDADVQQAYRDRAAKVRDQGYAVARIDEDRDGYDRLGEALSEYGLGELSPARDREVRGVFFSSGAYFGGSISPEERHVDLASIVVPVLDPTCDEPRNSGLVLRLGHLPQGVDGRQALEWVTALQEAAAAVRATLRTAKSSDFARYADAGLRTA